MVKSFFETMLDSMVATAQMQQQMNEEERLKKVESEIKVPNMNDLNPDTIYLIHRNDVLSKMDMTAMCNVVYTAKISSRIHSQEEYLRFLSILKKRVLCAKNIFEFDIAVDEFKTAVNIINNRGISFDSYVAIREMVQ